MNHSEKAEYHDESAKYLNDHQVREKFQKALAELVLQQPADPISFLIKFFEKRKKFLTFSVVGILDQERSKVVSDLADKYNLKVVRVDPKLMERSEEGDHNNYSSLLSSLVSFETKFDGIVLDNFPSTKTQLKALRQHKVLCDRVFNLIPTKHEIAQLSDRDRIKYNNIEYCVDSMRPIVTTMNKDELAAFPSKISNVVLLRTKGITPVKPPRVLVFYHPCRTELKTHLKSVASYFDLRGVSIEQTLIDQREKLKRMGSNCHEILTKVHEVPDDVEYR